MMTKKALWLSRHAPLGGQRDILESAGFQVKQIKNTWTSASQLSKVIRKEKAEVVVIVAPLSLIGALLQEKGLPPLLRAEMAVICQEPCSCQIDSNNETVAAGRHYRFIEFRRIIRCELVTEAWNVSE